MYISRHQTIRDRHKIKLYGQFEPTRRLGTSSAGVLSREFGRSTNPAHFYCRGTGFLALVAITVMCLAHIDPCSSGGSSSAEPGTGTIFYLTAHSCPSDRGMTGRTLTIIEIWLALGWT